MNPLQLARLYPERPTPPPLTLRELLATSIGALVVCAVLVAAFMAFISRLSGDPCGYPSTAECQWQD